MFLFHSPILLCACLAISESGEELPTVVASLLFTVHPVHVEVRAPIGCLLLFLG